MAPYTVEEIKRITTPIAIEHGVKSIQRVFYRPRHVAEAKSALSSGMRFKTRNALQCTALRVFIFRLWREYANKHTISHY